ncbi:hypothetical protein HHX47_DHR1001864 [Lentinula edodes]|nr:hypothetical protein HHX47_DHR1001864 [Lentinula edodes]
MGMLFLSSAQTVLAQAPVNDVVSWPSGLLLLASILYAALGTSPDRLWEIEPSSGIFLFSGLPKISIPLMQRVTWASNACHFVPGVRSANGVSNFWIRAENVTASARAEALQKALSLLQCVSWDIRTEAVRELKLDTKIWKLSPEGLIYPTSQVAFRPNAKPLISTPDIKLPSLSIPLAWDFLLFAAIEYHAIQHWVVEVRRKEHIFSTYGMPFYSVVNVDSEEDALVVVAAQMVRRPHGQSSLRARAREIMDPQTEHFFLDLDAIDLDVPICSIDFHAYAPEHNGRMTFINLPETRANWKVSADHAYLTRVESVLAQLESVANTPAFESTVTGAGGISRGTAMPFLVAGLIGQMIICYFLSVGTSAGEGLLRQGFLLNILGLTTAVLGAIFQSQTRDALGFSPFTPTPSWVVYTSIALCVGTSAFIVLMLVLQYIREKTWTEDAMFPTRVMAYTTLSASLIVVALAILFRVRNMPELWPILDALTWISGLPLGTIENGRLFSVDDNILHLVLLNRWMMGAVASAVGSSGRM